MLRFLLALLLLAVPAAAGAQPDFPKLSGRVVDEAHLLSPEQVAALTRLSAETEQASTRQLVVATIPDLQGHDIADYGYQLLRSWGIGQKGANNGLILIVAPNERKVRIEVGYGLEPIMTDALSSQIINETIIPRFKAGDVPGGIVAGAQAIAEQLKAPPEAAEQRIKDAAQKTSQARQQKRGGGGFPFGLLFWGIVLVFVILPMLGFGLGRRRRGPWGARRYQSDGGALPIVLWTIASEIGREASRGDWGGGSSGWGGGGGDWGGGGGFSGGGGSGGGGGASGSW